MYELEVVNPVSPQRGEVSAFPYAPRPSSLKDKVIGLMWNGKAHGDDALKRAGELIDGGGAVGRCAVLFGRVAISGPVAGEGDNGDRCRDWLYGRLRELHVVACLRHG